MPQSFSSVVFSVMFLGNFRFVQICRIQDVTDDRRIAQPFSPPNVTSFSINCSSEAGGAKLIHRLQKMHIFAEERGGVKAVGFSSTPDELQNMSHKKMLKK